MKKILIYSVIIIASGGWAAAGDTLHLSIVDAIALAKEQSVSAVMAENRFERSYWEYRTFKADQLPEISFQGNIPSYRKDYTSYQHDDGSYSFVRNNNLGFSGGINISQNIPFTGGQISVGTSLDFTRQMGSGASNEFMSLPVTITLIQPIFGVNTMKWDRRIEPVRYEEAQAKHLEEMEEVTLSAISYYFNFLLAESNLLVEEQNLKNATKLYEVAQARRKIGQISQSDLMQLKLEALQSKGRLTEAHSNLRAKMFQIRAFLGLEETQQIALEVPETIPVSGLDYSKVLGKALENNSFAKNILRRQAEADYAVATAKGNRRRIDLFASFGYSGVNKEFTDAYSNLSNNQVLEVGLNIPILDWGKRKAKVKVAESNREVEESLIKEDHISFTQDIFLLVESFNNQATQLEIAIEADKIAQLRYTIAIETFISGEINILDLNDARDSKDDAMQKLIEEMYMYWNYYYNIQSVSLVKVTELI